MKNIYIKSFYIFYLILALIGCKQNHANQVKQIYKKSKSKYPKEYTSHFPEEIPDKGVSSSNLLPAGVYYLHYWGFQLFINYEDYQQKDDYLKVIKNKFIDTTVVSGKNTIFLTSIKKYCDSIDNKVEYIVYPFPDIKEEIELLNFEVFNDTVEFSKDWGNYTFFTIEQKDTIIYDEQRTNSCQLLERELKHGFSRGVALNEKDQILFYWLYFW